jgi:DNA-binding NtrC family response regulator
MGMGSSANTYFENQTVLIVDDSESYASVLRRLLSAGLGVKEVQCCTSPQAAEELLATDPMRFSMLFVDFRFPAGGSGVELLERIQASVPVDVVRFLITSEPTPENVKRALAAGASAVVAKPFDRAALSQQVSNALRRRVGSD